MSLRLAPTLAFPVRPGTERDIGSSFGAPRDAGDRNHHGSRHLRAARDACCRRRCRRRESCQRNEHRGQGRLAARHVRELALLRAPRQPGRLVRHAASKSVIRSALSATPATRAPRHHTSTSASIVAAKGRSTRSGSCIALAVTVPRLVADTTRLGDWIRPANGRAMLLASPLARADTVAPLARHSAMRVLSAAGEYFRVRLPDGATGFVHARFIELCGSRHRQPSRGRHNPFPPRRERWPVQRCRCPCTWVTRSACLVGSVSTCLFAPVEVSQGGYCSIEPSLPIVGAVLRCCALGSLLLGCGDRGPAGIGDGYPRDEQNLGDSRGDTACGRISRREGGSVDRQRRDRCGPPSG